MILHKVHVSLSAESEPSVEERSKIVEWSDRSDATIIEAHLGSEVADSYINRTFH